jgi:ubiquinone/menaquinone biosynthesis C-methylase UbiE
MNTDIDRANAAFWDELCGSALAQHLGITDHSKESLQHFDKAYFDFYPYLLKHVQLDKLVKKCVLEIGLGYGTLGQKIFECSGWYQGLDVSVGPVQMMNHRLRLSDGKGIAIQGSARCMPFKDGSFDQVISIGCFHHTGNAEKCVHETYRVLRPGGRAVIMLYNRFSYRQWSRWPLKTALALIKEKLLSVKGPVSTQSQRKAYDTGRDGEAAPETDFFSSEQIAHMFSRFSSVKLKKENCDPLGFPRLRLYIGRERLLPYIGNFLGLDYYIEALKKD